ncbi:MAG: hypothetical protein ACKO96_17320 [Flammeovirgaceae bacterium]
MNFSKIVKQMQKANPATVEVQNTGAAITNTSAGFNSTSSLYSF